MKNLTRRAASFLLVLCLLAGLALPAVSADPARITISSVEDLLAFAKNCSLDTWSQGKTVCLTADLNLTGEEFTPIPTFGGTFLGEGHKITGLNITDAGSNMGLFRYLQEGAVVQSLYVSGSVRPGGSAVNVGGIAGNNAGAVRNCSFSGTVEGTGAVGGIVGLNRETGEVARAIVSGTVSGEDATGGVAGRNLGGLLQCESMASVNTATPDTDTAGMDMDVLTLTLESMPNEDDEDGFLKNHNDTGGIAGYSSGVIYICTNTGTIGYPHVGYNVGGVAGRQCGHVLTCVNRGQVYGRKDVGGIVGQSEPDIALSPNSGTLDRLRQELDTLEALINRTLDRTDGHADSISARLSVIGLSTDAARDHTKALLDQLDQFAGENITSLNSLSATATQALGDLTPALEELSEVSGRIEALANRLETALAALGSAAEDGEGVSADASHAAGVFRRAGELLSAAVRDLRAAMDALQSAVVVQDPAAVDAGLADLSAALEAFGSAMEQAGQAADALRGVLESFPALDGLGDVLKEQLAPSLTGMGMALRQAGSALKTITASTSLDWSQVRASLKEAGAGFQNLGSTSERLNDAIAAFQTALGSLGGLSGRLGSAVKDLADAAALAAPVGRGLERAFDILESVTQGLAEDGPIQLTPLSEAARESSRGLFSSLADLSQEMKDLNSAVSSAGDSLSADLHAISRQFNTVFEVLLDALADIRDGTGGASRELLEDTSDEDIAATRYGKVANCWNDGAVDGDRNVGGVVGTMSIEYDLDPEGDLELSFGSTYETKAVLESSENYGSVTAKKDCAGGMVGRMDLGTVLDCENYGPVASTSGSYVGGVAGLADGVVRESFAKCALSGIDDIGGIAGWAGKIRNCCAIATVLEGTERVGAIAGSGELEGVRNNFFIDTGVAGIDGVSYAGIAQPLTFDELRALPDIPERFTAFTLSLTANGKTIQEIPFTYGQDLSRIELPPVPELEGFYGEWPEFDTSGLNSDIILEAVYTPWITLLASGEREGKLALALAEGRFTEEAVLHASVNLSSTAESSAVWEIILTGTDLGPSDEVPLRLLNTLDGRAEVLGYQDGQWVPLHARTNGSYLLVTMTGTFGSFQIVPARSSGPLSALLLLAAVLFALLAALQIRKRKQAAKEPAKT